MSIFSNSLVRGSFFAIAIIGVGFFVYQSVGNTSIETEATTTEATEIAEAVQVTTAQAPIETADVINTDSTNDNAVNTVNSGDETDTINTAVENTTNQ